MTGLSRDEAAAAVAAAVAERDAIQTNLLDLDGSFGKRLLAGAPLAGETRRRWEAASHDLATLWETFAAYSAVVDRANETLPGIRRSPADRLAEISSLLTQESVRLTQTAPPIGARSLTDTGTVALTISAAVTQMRRVFADVSEVVTVAEAVWNQTAEQLQQLTAGLDTARQEARGLADEALAGALAAAEADLRELRELLNSDPLALWRGGGVDLARVTRLRERVDAAADRADELARLRADADRRIAVVTSVVAAARAAWQDAQASRQRAGAKVAGPPLPAPPDVSGLAGRLAALDQLKAAGRWSRLAAELDGLNADAAAAADGCRDAERDALGRLEQRDELRGRLDAYRAQAIGLGAAEDVDLDARHARARELLWQAPCDLSAAAEAVTGYQQAVRALRGRRQGP